jgi:hypothetical protein
LPAPGGNLRLLSLMKTWSRLWLWGILAMQFAGASVAAPQRPNVLIILIDDHPFNFTDVYQKSAVHTPSMQRLADRGTWFGRGYNDAPICCASRTALPPKAEVLPRTREQESSLFKQRQQLLRGQGGVAAELRGLPLQVTETVFGHDFFLPGFVACDAGVEVGELLSEFVELFLLCCVALLGSPP